MSTFPNLKLGNVHADFNPFYNGGSFGLLQEDRDYVDLTFDQIEQLYTWAASVYEGNLDRHIDD